MKQKRKYVQKKLEAIDKTGSCFQGYYINISSNAYLPKKKHETEKDRSLKTEKKRLMK